MESNYTSLKELIDIKEWQKMQDSIARIADVGLRTLDYDGTGITLPSQEARICRIHKRSHLKDELCGECLPTFLGGKGIVDRNLGYVCHMGLHTFITPLKLEGAKIVGYVIMGPVVLIARKPKEEYRKTAETLGIDLDECWNAILEVRVISFQRAQAIIELIKSFGEYLIRLAAKRISAEQELAESSPQINELLKVFLDVALHVSGADIGSIMLLKKESNELTIRVAKGLSDEVIKDTKVKLGEGISGTAAKENTPMVLDDNVKDNRIRRHLNRPYIRSSMVLPIQVANQPLGVMNLGALETSPVRFNDANLQTMNRLVNLATFALRPPLRQ
ncbi:MAG TPA: PocR ligand-binding domain-containing protein [Patescibacteria group bacterium]|nr:PocR ligand-binding domain-containing protein [Patescibacteria group bacterium]